MKGKTKNKQGVEMKKLNSKIQYVEFYFFCSHCEHTNDSFTDDEQIVDGIKCEGCVK